MTVYELIDDISALFANIFALFIRNRLPIALSVISVILYWRFGKPFADERRRTATTWGTVIALPMKGFARRLPHPQIKFLTLKGEEITFVSQIGTSMALWPIGCQAHVTYDPDDPQNADIKLSPLIKIMWAIVVIFVLSFFIGTAIDILGAIFSSPH